jgi:hypothetical protein
MSHPPLTGGSWLSGRTRPPKSRRLRPILAVADCRSSRSGQADRAPGSTAPGSNASMAPWTSAFVVIGCCLLLPGAGRWPPVRRLGSAGGPLAMVRPYPNRHLRALYRQVGDRRPDSLPSALNVGDDAPSGRWERRTVILLRRPAVLVSCALLVVSVHEVRLSAVCAAQVRGRIPARRPESCLLLAGGLPPGPTLAALQPGDRVEVQVEDIGVLTNEAEAELAAENVRRVTASARTLLQSGAGRAATTAHEGRRP